MKIRVTLPYRSAVVARILGAQLLLLMVVLVSALWGQLGSPDDGTVEVSRAATMPRRYYLTSQLHSAGEARSACTLGYHFASLSEISDPSDLLYDTSLGLQSADSGAGPPTAYYLLATLRAVGWVRTGWTTSASEPPGHANCYGWLTNDSMLWGSAASLPNDWSAGDQDLGVWALEVRTCNSLLRVWCIQDHGSIFADDFESGGTSAWSSGRF